MKPASSLPYDPHDLEINIDNNRLLSNWPTVLSLVERYARIFDVGAASPTSEVSGNEMHGRSRAYYWCVMAELMLYHTQNLDKAAYCVAMAFDHDKDYWDWRIINVRVLLERTKDSLLDIPLAVEKKTNAENDTSQAIITPAPLHPSKILSSCYRVLKLEEQEALTSSLENLSLSHMQAILTALSLLSPSELVLICKDVLLELQQNVEKNHITNQWVLAIARHSLSPIQLERHLSSFLSRDITGYVFWMRLDAVYARSVMHELNGHLLLARRDVEQVVDVVRALTGPITKLPQQSLGVILHAACRLPLLELELDLMTEALQSFRLCISSDSILQAMYPTVMHICLRAIAGDLLLKYSYVVTQRNRDANRPNALPEETVPHVENAFALLKYAKKIMSSVTDSTRSRQSSIESSVMFQAIAMQQSVSRLIPESRFNPDRVAQSVCASQVAVSLAGSLLRLPISARGEDPLEVLEWGAAQDAGPSLELLWNLAVMYTKLGKKQEGIEIMMQCMDILESKSQEAQVRGRASRDDVLTWLGFGPQPATYPWLPAVNSASIALNELCDAVQAEKHSFNGISRLYHPFAEIVALTPDTDVTRDITSPDLEGIPPFLTPGIFPLLLVHARAKAARCRTGVDSDGLSKRLRAHTVHILKYLSETKSLPRNDADDEHCLVEYGVLLGEMGEISTATEVVKNAINRFPNSSKLLHLLSLLLSCPKGDVAIATAALNACSCSLHASPGNQNIKLTLALLKWSMGEKEQAMRLLDEVLLAVDTPNPNTILEQQATTTRKSYEFITTLMCTSSQLFRLVNNVSRAQYCLEVAFKYIYEYSMRDISPDDTKSDDIESSFALGGWDVLIKQVCAARNIPTLPGMRLPSATGWGAGIPSHCEAALIGEFGEIALCVGKRDVARRLLAYATSICPRCVPVLVSSAKAELEASSTLPSLEVEEPVDVAYAYGTIQNALLLRDRDRDVW